MQGVSKKAFKNQFEGFKVLKSNITLKILHTSWKCIPLNIIRFQWGVWMSLGLYFRSLSLKNESLPFETPWINCVLHMLKILFDTWFNFQFRILSYLNVSQDFLAKAIEIIVTKIIIIYTIYDENSCSNEHPKVAQLVTT